MIDEVVILAAGKSRRMDSALNKVLEPLAGRPMIAHVLDIARELGVLAPIVVVGHQAEAVTGAASAVAGMMPIFVTQADPAGGTGDAVMAARDYLAGEYVAVLYGDMPFVRAETLYRLATLVREQAAVMGIVTTPIDVASHFGRMLRNSKGDVIGIVEWQNATDEQRAITEGNAGIYVFLTAWLLAALPTVTPNPVNNEIYLTDLVERAVSGQQKVVAIKASDPREAHGINTPEELARARELTHQGFDFTDFQSKIMVDKLHRK